MRQLCFLYYVFTVYGLAAGATQNGPSGCVLPPYPPHGTYTVYNRPEAVPGQTYDFAILTVSCDPGYAVIGSNGTHCYGGNMWLQPLPQCTRFCRLTPNPSVKYSCKVTGDDMLNCTRRCHELEPDGTVVVPECNPVYYSSVDLPNMRCVGGTWDHIAVCQPDCGTSTPIGERLIINGTRVIHGELPWHAAIYDKTYTPFMQVCGGSLISTKIVISAAHCFWDDATGRQQPASRYAVALGKIYRPWNSDMDPGAHLSNVSEIRIPVRFMGAVAHNQDDIALVVMAAPVVYVTYIRPVCIDFDVEFDRNQLQNTNAGRVSGWGLTSADGVASQELLTMELSYVDVEKCIANLPQDFRPYVTSDKICAGGNATTVCRGDSGGGLAFPHVDRSNRRRYFLRGVVSTAPTNGHKCNTNSYTTFTHILPHAAFIKDHGLDIVAVHDRYLSLQADHGLEVIPVHDGPVRVGGCVLPAYPPHGTYTVHNKPDAAPGQTHDTAVLTVTCNPWYGLVGNNITYCFGSNNWQEPMPQCSPRIPPKVKIWPRGELDVSLGDDFEFHCRVLSGEPPPEIIWSRSDGRPLKPSTRVQPQHDVLMIDRIEVTDEGGYICTATNLAGEASANASLKLTSVPKITLIPESLPYKNQGENIDMECRASGYPVPIVSIMKHGRSGVIQAGFGTASLHIINARWSDCCEYVCKAVSTGGTAEAAFWVHLHRYG